MRNLWKIVVGLLTTAVGLGCEGIAFAAYFKSVDTAVMRAGMASDFFNLAIIAGGLGLAFFGLAIWILWLNKPKKPDLVAPF